MCITPDPTVKDMKNEDFAGDFVDSCGCVTRVSQLCGSCFCVGPVCCGSCFCGMALVGRYDCMSCCAHTLGGYGYWVDYKDKDTVYEFGCCKSTRVGAGPTVAQGGAPPAVEMER